jgi:hypothetical protein
MLPGKRVPRSRVNAPERIDQLDRGRVFPQSTGSQGVLMMEIIESNELSSRGYLLAGW